MWGITLASYICVGNIIFKRGRMLLFCSVEARFRDIDFSKYDVSFPSRSLGLISSPLAAVPMTLLYSTRSPTSPASSCGQGTVLESKSLSPCLQCRSFLKSICFFYLFLWITVLMYKTLYFKGFYLFVMI